MAGSLQTARHGMRYLIFYFASGSCTRGSAGGGVRVECSTTKAAALARARAAAFVVEHSTLTPPPAEPLVQEPEAK